MFAATGPEPAVSTANAATCCAPESWQRRMKNESLFAAVDDTSTASCTLPFTFAQSSTVIAVVMLAESTPAASNLAYAVGGTFSHSRRWHISHPVHLPTGSPLSHCSPISTTWSPHTAAPSLVVAPSTGGSASLIGAESMLLIASAPPPSDSGGSCSGSVPTQ